MTDIATAPAHNEVVNGLTPQERRHLGALERRIEKGVTTFRDVGMALREIRDTRLYRETHASFEAYCRERWQFERGRAYQLMDAAEVAANLPDGAPPILNEAQARELVVLQHENPALVPRVWEQVTASDAPVTAPRIREVVRMHIRPPHDPPPPITESARFVDTCSRFVEAYRRWDKSEPTRAERTHVRGVLRQVFAELKV